MLAWLAENYQWIVVAGSVALAGILGFFYLRARNKQTIHETQTETIEALQRLLDTRTAERDEFKRLLDHETGEHEKTNGELAALRSEFKIVGAIVLDELLAYWSRRTEVMAELAAAKADKQILELTIARLQTNRAEIDM